MDPKDSVPAARASNGDPDARLRPDRVAKLLDGIDRSLTDTDRQALLNTERDLYDAQGLPR